MLRKPFADVVTFAIDGQERMAATGAYDDRGAGGLVLGRKENGQARIVDIGNFRFDGASLLELFLFVFPGFEPRSAAGPKRHHRGARALLERPDRSDQPQQ
jgi:hypothetical protein